MGYRCLYVIQQEILERRETFTSESPSFLISIPSSVPPLSVSVLPRASLPLMPYGQFRLLAKPYSCFPFHAGNLRVWVTT